MGSYWCMALRCDWFMDGHIRRDGAAQETQARAYSRLPARQMSSWLIAVTGCIYLYIAIEQALKGNLSMGVVYAGYAFSNVGLYLLAK